MPRVILMNLLIFGLSQRRRGRLYAGLTGLVSSRLLIGERSRKKESASLKSPSPGPGASSYYESRTYNSAAGASAAAYASIVNGLGSGDGDVIGTCDWRGARERARERA